MMIGGRKGGEQKKYLKSQKTRTYRNCSRAIYVLITIKYEKSIGKENLLYGSPNIKMRSTK